LNRLGTVSGQYFNTQELLHLCCSFAERITRQTESQPLFDAGQFNCAVTRSDPSFQSAVQLFCCQMLFGCLCVCVCVCVCVFELLRSSNCSFPPHFAKRVSRRGILLFHTKRMGRVCRARATLNCRIIQIVQSEMLLQGGCPHRFSPPQLSRPTPGTVCS
jgi:hypothetical protein